MTDPAGRRAAAFAALREKYEAMLALRELHLRAKAEPSFVEPDPRAALVSLARRFPGALREIDALPIDVIRARIGALDGAANGGAAEPWMIAQDHFHALARAALAAKRWLGRRRDVDDATRASFDATAPEDARPWRDDLASLARPPRGRILDVVFARVARDLAITADEARRLVFA